MNAWMATARIGQSEDSRGHMSPSISTHKTMTLIAMSPFAA